MDLTVLIRSEKNELRPIRVALCLLAILLSVALTNAQPVASMASQTPYASQGSYATYDALGGFIPFFDGVNGTVSYMVTSVFPNLTMGVMLSANISQGNEVPTSDVTYNFTDNVGAPKIFPAVPLSDFSQKTFTFQNATCTFDKNSTTTVPAGTFDTFEYTGVNATGSKSYYWFDRNSGLIVQMAGNGAVFELLNSNVAIPTDQPNGLSVSLPYVLVFVLGWIFAAAMFLGLRRYYLVKSRKSANKSVSSKA